MAIGSLLADLGLAFLIFSIAPVLVSLVARIRPIRALAQRGPAARRAIILAAVLLSLALNLGLYAGFAWYWARFTYANPNLMEATCAHQKGWSEREIWVTFMIPPQLREMSCLDRVHRGLYPTWSLLVTHPTLLLSLTSIVVAGELTRRAFSPPSGQKRLLPALYVAFGVGALGLIISTPLLATMSTYPGEHPAGDLVYPAGDLVMAMPAHVQNSGGTAALAILNLLPLPWILTRVAPSIVAVVAARFTARQIEDPATREVNCILASLYRVRYLLALVAGLAPTLILWGAYLTTIGIEIFLPTLLCSLCEPRPEWSYPDWYYMDTWDIKTHATIWHVATTIGWWSMTLLAATLAEELTTRWQKATLAAIATIAATSIIPILPDLPALLLTGQPALVISSWPLAYMACLVASDPCVSMIVLCLLLLGVLGIAALISKKVERWLCKAIARG